jgi:hypothetical protein
MHDQRKAASPAAEDLRTEMAVLSHVMEAFPQTLRLSDVIREMGGSDDFRQRDGIERAVRDLVMAGLLFRCESAVLPTRTALRAYELLVEEA